MRILFFLNIKLNKVETICRNITRTRFDEWFVVDIAVSFVIGTSSIIMPVRDLKLKCELFWSNNKTRKKNTGAFNKPD